MPRRVVPSPPCPHVAGLAGSVALVPSFPLLRSHASSELVTAADSAGGVAWMTHVGSSSAVPPALPAFPLRSDSPKLSNHRPLRSPAGCPHPDSTQVAVIGRVIQRRSGELRWTRTAPRSGDDGPGGFRMSHQTAECACLCHGRGGSCPRSSPSRYCIACLAE